MWEKPRQSTNCRIHYGRRVQQREHTEATTSCSLLRHTRRLQWRQRPLSFSHDVSHTISVHTSYTTTLQKCLTTFIYYLMLALSHIYTYMTFGLFTHVSPSNRSGRIGTGSSVIRFSLTSIRRDLFPNKLPLHSGMGCRCNPICFRHAPSLSGVSTLVSMSDPFSVVWIFVSTNSRSSTRSRI